MNPNPQIPIYKSQVEAEIGIFESKIRIQREMLESSMDKEVKERRLVLEFCKSQGFGTIAGPAQSVLSEYLKAHDRVSKAQEDAQRMNLKELESQVVIRKAMLREGERKIVDPGRLKI